MNGPACGSSAPAVKSFERSAPQETVEKVEGYVPAIRARCGERIEEGLLVDAEAPEYRHVGKHQGEGAQIVDRLRVTLLEGHARRGTHGACNESEDQAPATP